MRTSEQQTTPPAAPFGWFLSDSPSEGALVVPLGSTPDDIADALSQGWTPARVVRVGQGTRRGTARRPDGSAVAVVWSSRGGGGWRCGGVWVRFATPAERTPSAAEQRAAQAPFAAVLLADEPQPAQTAEQARAARAAADERDAAEAAAREAEQDAQEEAAWAAHLAQLIAGQRPVRPAWLYGNGSLPQGEVTYVDDEDRQPPLADDAPDTTPRPALSVFAEAAWAAVAKREAHEASCPRCSAEARGGVWCAVWTRLARAASDAQQAAHSALATCR